MTILGRGARRPMFASKLHQLDYDKFLQIDSGIEACKHDVRKYSKSFS